MALIFSYRYQHHDPHLLDPVEIALMEKGHVIMRVGFAAFLRAQGPKAMILAGDHVTLGHVEGMARVKKAANNDIPTLSVQHGAAAAFPNPGDEPMGVSSDVRCTWGTFWHDWFDCSHLEPTGSPQHDSWLEYEKREQKYALLVPAFREDAKVKGLAGLSASERAQVYVEEAGKVGWDGEWLVRPHPSDYKHRDREMAYEFILRWLPGTHQSPYEFGLYDVLPQCALVMGTSTVVLEGMVFGCDPIPLFMDYLPKNLKKAKDEILGPLDGKNTERVVSTLEWLIETRTA